MEFLKWLYNNKQSILANIMAGLSVLQVSGELPNLVEPQTYKWIMLSIAVVMSIFARSASGDSVVNKVLPQSLPPGGPG